MRRKTIWWKRLALVAGLLFGVYVVVEIILAGGGAPPPPPNQAPIDLRGGHVLNNHIATKSWSFDYDHARLSSDGLSGSVDGVRNGIVFRKGKPYLRISAKHVQLNVQSLDFTAVGKVQHRTNRRCAAALFRYGPGNVDERRETASYAASELRSLRRSNAEDRRDHRQLRRQHRTPGESKRRSGGPSLRA